MFGGRQTIMKLSPASSSLVLLVLGGTLLGAGCTAGRVDLGGPNDVQDGGGDVAQLPDAGADTGADTGADAGPDAPLASTTCVSTGSARTPLASEMTPYSTEAQLRALLVGRWIQYEGQCIHPEEVGTEFTEDTYYRLVRASDGSLQRLSGEQAWSLTLDTNGMPRDIILGTHSTYEFGAPTFFDGGQNMHSLEYPWYTNWHRVP